MDGADILEDNITRLYSLLWGKCTETLQQGLCGHEDFEDKDISFYSKWLLHQIKLTTQGIKEERYSNPYNSLYKLIRQFFHFHQAEDELFDKFLKSFLDLRSSLHLSGVDVTTQSRLTDIECKNLIKADP